MKPKVNQIARRQFLKTTGACAVGAWAGGMRAPRAFGADTQPASPRDFHASFAVSAFEKDPELLARLRGAGINHIWLVGFFYGYWPFPMEKIRDWRKKIEAAGISVHVINLSLGHPGDSLGAQDGTFPLTPPKNWKPGVSSTGQVYAGTSLHAPATDENCAALQLLEREGIDRVFVDDDFRLARYPGLIGGCFCAEHQKRFLEGHGYAPQRWKELIDDANARRRTPLLDEWIEFTCDDLSGCFAAMRKAAPRISLGSMVMYLGAEKAGIRLKDYAGVPMRVGESMFNDNDFGTVQGKTNELFSALFHRRFVKPELAYSETTAYPSNSLSAANMAAKLNVSTIADVHHTMLMSGIVPVPRSHWTVMAPTIRRQTEAHAVLAGHVPRGPFKHLWTDDDRRVGDDNPFSLFLASGVPFEVCDAPGSDGYTFLSDIAVRAVAAGRVKSAGTQFIFRAGSGGREPDGRAIAGSLESIFALKQEVMKQMPMAPVVIEAKPVVCAWFPSARAVYLWNLAERRETFTLAWGENRKGVTIDPLDFALLRIT